MIVKDENYLDVLKEMVKSAKKSILISSAWIKKDALEEIFKDKDLDVVKDKRIIVRAGDLGDLEIDEPDSFAFLRNLGFEIGFHRDLHAKFIVIDKKLALIGSANLTPSGILGINREIGFLVQRNPQKVSEIVQFFETIWEEAVKVPNDLVGITMNPGKSRSVEILVLSEDLKENEFVVVENDPTEILCRIETMMVYDTSFFMNPFTTTEAGKFPPFEEFEFINKIPDTDWRVAALTAFLKSSFGSSVTIATAKVLGKITNAGKGYELKSVFEPIPPKLWVRKPRREILENLETPSGGRKIRIGRFYNIDIGYFLDFDEITSTHMAVLGTTGSGKSYFTKLLISRIADKFDDVSIYVIDPHGEYVQKFGENKHVVAVDIPPNPFLLTSDEQVRDFIKKIAPLGNSGEGFYNNLVIEYHFSGKDVDEISETFKRMKISSEQSAEEDPIIVHHNKSSDKARKIAEKIFEEFKKRFENSYGEITKALQKTEGQKISIFDFSKIDDPNSRVAVAALIMDYLFKEAKKRGDGKRRIIVLEEAHNFVPERSAGDVPAGKSNPAFRSAYKIASEGRKFNVVLFTITQRPANVSKYILAQSNTMAIFRLINEMDLKAISESAESVSKGVVELLPSLGRGEAFVFGLGAPIPALVQIDSF